LVLRAGADSSRSQPPLKIHGSRRANLTERTQFSDSPPNRRPEVGRRTNPFRGHRPCWDWRRTKPISAGIVDRNFLTNQAGSAPIFCANEPNLRVAGALRALSEHAPGREHAV